MYVCNYGAHLATYEQLAQYSTCTCGPHPLLLALVVFFHSQLPYLLFTATCGGPIVTSAGGLFPFPASAFTLLPHVVVLLLVALCGGYSASCNIRH